MNESRNSGRNLATRRSFLKTSGMAVAGTAMASAIVRPGWAAEERMTPASGGTGTGNAGQPSGLPANAEARSLPFAMSITKIQFDNQPDYFGGGPGNPYSWVDFPICPVLIDDEYWIIYKNGDIPTVYRWKGTNIENGKRQPDGSAPLPVKRPYMLGGMWYDASEKKLYAPMHCEFYEAQGEAPQRQIHLASSSDKGLTWRYEGPIMTRDHPNGPFHTSSDYSGLYWDGGAGDFFIYVDQRGGYVYLYAGTYVWPKKGVQGRGFVRHHVARCAFSDKMMPGKWRKFYNGRWDEPGLGGKASYVNAYYVMYNSFLEKYIGLSYGSSLAVCSDLSKQDWTPCFKIKGDYWGCNGVWAWHVVDADKIDIFSGGRTLFLYSYWKANSQQTPTQLYRIALSPGVTPDTDGYSPEGVFFAPTTSMEAMTFYPCEPLYESADPIESRHTRRVICSSPEMSYSGEWTMQDCGGYFENVARESGMADSTVQFAFKGSDVYWRAAKGPSRGRADVYVDNLFQKTIDCYANRDTVDQFAFVKSDLAPDVIHTIKVVVRGDKNALSKGTTIKHCLFEYSAESYRASDGFCSVNGKNQWYYQQRNGSVYTDMSFKDDKWRGEGCELGHYHMIPGANDTVRKWAAPHAGTIRVEGKVTVESTNGEGVHAAILRNSEEAWPSRLLAGKKTEVHDMTLAVNRGDALYFIVSRNGDKAGDKVIWDPAITYVDTPAKT